MIFDFVPLFFFIYLFFSKRQQYSKRLFNWWSNITLSSLTQKPYY